LGIKMIPSYSPQARGRMERSYRTWQGRLPQELRVRQITTVEEANRFLREEYRAELNRRFAVALNRFAGCTSGLLVAWSPLPLHKR
jgi:hypothetical protein